ncbi:MAG: 50S ribosomal protein L9 [Leifsonia sp.]|nr:50S ribosomal protein L9 [Leifsonia sp.]|tara:strand:+ start:75899 stop:76351 length:453 start_codon:yes stop_codon:yes gene_type:complete
MSKLILTNEVSGLGSAGDVVEVKNGYARNYLIPQGFAVAWSKGGEKQVEQIKSARAARELATLEEAQALKAKLEGATVKLSVKSGSEGRLFGSVKTADVVAAVAAAGLGAIDKRTVELSAPIKALGSHEATVRLREDVVATLSIEVVSAK